MGTFEEYIETLKSKTASRFYRKEAIWELGRLGDERAVEPLSSALQDKDEQVRIEAARALAKLGSSLAVEPLIVALRKDEDKWVRGVVVEALTKLGSSLAVEALIAALKEDEDASVQRTIISALGEVGDARAIEPLKQIQEAQSSLKQTVEYNLQRIKKRLELTLAEEKAEISQEAENGQLKGGGVLETGTPTPESDYPKEVRGTSQEAKVEDQQEAECSSLSGKETQEATEPQHAENIVSGVLFLLKQNLSTMVNAENTRFHESVKSISDVQSKYKKQEDLFIELRDSAEELDKSVGDAIAGLDEESFKKAFEGVEPRSNSYRIIEACLRSLSGMSRVNIGEFARRVAEDKLKIDKERDEGERALNELTERFQQIQKQVNIGEIPSEKSRQIADSFLQKLLASAIPDLPDPLEREKFYSNTIDSTLSFLFGQIQENIKDGISGLDIIPDTIREMHSLRNQVANTIADLGKKCNGILSLVKDRLELIIPQFNSLDELLSISEKLGDIKDQEIGEDALRFAEKLRSAFEEVNDAMVSFREKVGITQISPEVGALVDYKKHEPIEAKELEDKEEGLILEVNRLGYELNFDGSVLQMASVTIAKKPRTNA